MKKTALAFAALLFLSARAQQPVSGDKRLEGLEKTFSRLPSEWNAAGFAVAVVEKDKLIYAKGFGYRDYEKKLPVTPNTLFAIGSCTKAFTAALIGLLEQEGKVEYDKPVTHYYPQLHFYNDALNTGVTLRSMMSHTTGLPRHDFSWFFFTTASRDSMLQRLQYMEPTHGLRERWQYNNFMYTAQGALAEKLTGASWEDNIRKKFFVPLNMQRSNFSVQELEKDEDAAKGYDIRKNSLIHRMDYYPITSMGPAGSINSSVAEMANWLRAWINNGNFNGREVLPSSFRSEAISSQAVVSSGLPVKQIPDVFFANYGFGWMLSSYKGHYRVEHGGNINGFSASTAFFPTDSIGIVVLTNQNNSALPAVVRNLIADRLLKLPYFDWNKDQKTKFTQTQVAQNAAQQGSTQRKKGTVPTHPLSAFEGSFFHPAYGAMDVLTKGDSLFAQVSEQKLWLRHYHYNVFEPFLVDAKEGIDTTDGTTLLMQFQTGLSGDIESLSVPFEAGLKPLVFNRRAQAKEVTRESLQKYEGEYQLPGLITRVYLKNNLLFVYVPGQPEYELTPLGQHRFALKILNGYFVQFAVGGQGEVTALTFQQPNGNFTATRKK